jgi:serine/threonine-protein kinase HipA
MKRLNVYLCGKKVGILSEDDLSQLSFKYDSTDVMPLSVNLPVRLESYHHSMAYPFFENLTPEGDAFEILTKGHVSGSKTFSILDRFGGDCAGAVAFYELTPDSNDKELYEISASKITQIIDKQPINPLLTGMDNPPRLSLAGAQSKFAVYKYNEKYYRSNDENPTTHIIKINNKRFPNLLTNELFCMRLAKIMQLGVPEVELKETDNRQYIEITRYDRTIIDRVVNRIHQEDFCQALGMVSSRKYQTGSGAKLRDCYRIIDEFSENRLEDAMRFIQWIIFNYLIGNTDAHAKNLSLLHSDSGIKLAPFYDMLSTEIYPKKVIDHGMAMLINGKGKFSSLKPADFMALFETLGLNAVNMMKSVKNKFSKVVYEAENLREVLKNESISNSPVYDDIIVIIKKRFAILFEK